MAFLAQVQINKCRKEKVRAFSDRDGWGLAGTRIIVVGRYDGVSFYTSTLAANGQQSSLKANSLINTTTNQRNNSYQLAALQWAESSQIKFTNSKNELQSVCICMRVQMNMCTFIVYRPKRTHKLKKKFTKTHANICKERGGRYMSLSFAVYYLTLRRFLNFFIPLLRLYVFLLLKSTNLYLWTVH